MRLVCLCFCGREGDDKFDLAAPKPKVNRPRGKVPGYFAGRRRQDVEQHDPSRCIQSSSKLFGHDPGVFRAGRGGIYKLALQITDVLS